MNNQRIIICLFLFALIGCSPSVSTSPTPTTFFTPTSTLTATPTSTPKPTDTPIPPTPTPQILGRVFPEICHDQSVWSNASGDTPKDLGWRDHSGRDFVMHFDVQLPSNFGRDDQFLSPVDGVVTQIYALNDKEGSAMVIRAEPRISGIENIFSNQEMITQLTKGVYEFDYNFGDVKYTAFHFGHIIPLVSNGEKVRKGQPIAKIDFDTWFTPKLAYVIYLHMNDGHYYQFSPCSVPNQDEFCGKCAPGTPYNCP